MCESTRHFAGEQGPAALAIQKDTLAITCEVEQLLDRQYSLARQPQDYQWTFTPTCPKQGTVSTVEDLSQPLNIIFVIDITQSMLPSFKVITEKIFELNQELTAANRTVQMAGIGFSNYFRNYEVSNFLPGVTFANQIQTWQLVNVGPSAVAGQLAISVALDKFVALQHQSPNMSNAQNIIFYVADDPIFSQASQTDYTVDALVSQVQNANINNLQFYYSVPNSLSTENTVAGAPNPLVQIQEFVTKSSLSATQLPFPLTTQLLNTFSSQLVNVIKAPDQVCAIDTISFQSGSQASMPTVDIRNNVFAAVEKKTPFTFTLSPDPNTLNYWLEINRCCKKNQTETSCDSTDNVLLNYTFAPIVLP